MEISNEAPVKKTKRLTSVVWNHFERVRKADICYAICVHCKKKLSGSSNSGTTHLRNHLIRCLKKSNYDVSQILSAKRKKKENSLSISTVNTNEGHVKDEMISPVAYKFDQEHKKDEINKAFSLGANQTINLGSLRFNQERSRMDLARMIMLHGYQLTMVEHVGFRLFIRNIQPLFEITTTSDIEKDCMTIYEKERQKVYDMMHNLHGRICLAVDMWASHESARFMCLTANYIDEKWKLQKKILNFIALDPSQTGDILSEFLYRCLTDWDIDRLLFSMTFDDCSINDDMACRIKDWLSQNKSLLKNGELFDVRCAAHAIKSIVQDVMEALQDVIHKIRESVKYVKSSQTTHGKFNELAQESGINSEKHLLLDCPMRWNSTYLMLEAALEYKGAFSRLLEQDPAYTIPLSEREWEWASSVAGYLKLFVEVTNVFAGNEYPTANIYFPEICDVHIRLIEWCKSPDDFLSSVAFKMKTKFDGYWNKCSLALAIAAILDPRFKMKLVEYYYPQIYEANASDHIREVSDGVRELFNEYSMSLTALDQVPARPNGSLQCTSNGSRDRLRGFDRFLHETSQGQSIISDLDKYLEEPVFPRNYDFNILNWWKVHTPRYPILSMMARDILGIPVSTVGLDLAFSTGCRVLDRYSSSLNSEIRQALICGQDWLQVESGEANPSPSQSVLSHFVESN